MVKAFLSRSFTEKALIAAALASAALLAGAHVFEALGYPPCPLCLDQREAHWLALAVALAGLGAQVLFRARLAAAAAVGAAALVYVVSAGLAAYHTGVEWKFWPGPKSCAALASSPVSVGDLGEGLHEPQGAGGCADAPWRFLGLSMAGYNLLASAGLFSLSLAAALNAARQARRARKPRAATGEAATAPGEAAHARVNAP